MRTLRTGECYAAEDHPESVVPETEQCGWCRDRFNLSWQLVAKNLDELMRRPGAYAHLMQMKKLLVADF